MSRSSNSTLTFVGGMAAGVVASLAAYKTYKALEENNEEIQRMYVRQELMTGDVTPARSV